MARRYLSLYYASIAPRRAAEAVWDWVASLVIPAARSRETLHATVRERLGSRAAFSFGSGRSALAAGLRAAGVGEGDEVLLSAYSCLAVPTAVLAAGATPVYVDIDAETLNVDASTVIAAMGPRTRAVVVQHTLGKVAPVREIAAAARARGIIVIEDCALAIGTRLGDRAVGTFGDAAVFSMELSKTLSCGWGGVLAVNDATLADRARAFYDGVPEPSAWAATRDLFQTVISALCQRPSAYHAVGKYVLFAAFRSGAFRRSTPPGEFRGEIGPAFLTKLAGAQARLANRQWRDESLLAQHVRHADAMRQMLGEANFAMPGAPAPDEHPVTQRVSFLHPRRDLALEFFRQRGIELGTWFDGPMSPPPSSPRFNYVAGAYPRAEALARSIVNLPSNSRLSAADISHIRATLREFLQAHPTP